MTPLNLEQVEGFRLGSLPVTGAMSYKTPSTFPATQHAIPKSVSSEHHFSIESRRFQGSAMKKAALVKATNLIPLGHGRPDPELYPWHTDMQTGDLNFKTWQPSCQIGNDNVGGVNVPGYELGIALNYGDAGSPELIRFLIDHMRAFHKPPYMNWATCLSCGSTAALDTALRIFCNRGDSILSEKYTYANFIEVAELHGLRLETVKMDSEGLRPDDMDNLLINWDASKAPKPRILYTIPTGQNPTGTTQSTQRRRAIYDVAERHDILIIEDDPYYFLQLRQAPDSDIAQYTSNLPHSYLSIDKSGRVIRFDSASKILAPGLRAGWVTASDEIVKKFISYHEVTTGSVSGASQLMMYGLLEKSWGHRGFIDWLQDLSIRYSRRLDIVVQAFEEYLPRAICKYQIPSEGMFIWIELDWTKHPTFRNKKCHQAHGVDVDLQVLDLEEKILNSGLSTGVQVTKGSLYDATQRLTSKLHFRLTFSAAKEIDLVEGVRRFASVLNREFLI